MTTAIEEGRNVVVTDEGEQVIVEGIQKVHPGQIVAVSGVPGPSDVFSSNYPSMCATRREVWSRSVPWLKQKSCGGRKRCCVTTGSVARSSTAHRSSVTVPARVDGHGPHLGHDATLGRQLEWTVGQRRRVGALGAIVAVVLARLSFDVYAIGLMALIALAAKNGILIVAFAVE